MGDLISEYTELLQQQVKRRFNRENRRCPTDDVSN